MYWVWDKMIQSDSWFGLNKLVQLASIPPSGIPENSSANLFLKPWNWWLSIGIPSMNFVTPQPDAGQVNLSALPTMVLVLNMSIDFLLYLWLEQAWHWWILNTTLFSTVRMLHLNSLTRIFSVSRSMQYQRLWLLVVGEEMKVGANNGDLLGLVKQVSNWQWSYIGGCCHCFCCLAMTWTQLILFELFFSFSFLFWISWFVMFHDSHNPHNLCLNPFLYVFPLSHDHWIKRSPHCTIVRVLCLYPINPGRLSNQCHTGADRCTPTLPR